MKKPYQLRIIFILNALMMFLPFIFYYVITTKGIKIRGTGSNIYDLRRHRSSTHLLGYLIKQANQSLFQKLITNDLIESRDFTNSKKVIINESY